MKNIPVSIKPTQKKASHYDKSGKVFMEYMDEYGSFDDMPFELYLSELKKHYGHLVSSNKEGFYLQLD